MQVYCQQEAYASPSTPAIQVNHKYNQFSIIQILLLPGLCSAHVWRIAGH